MECYKYAHIIKSSHTVVNEIFLLHFNRFSTGNKFAERKLQRKEFTTDKPKNITKVACQQFRAYLGYAGYFFCFLISSYAKCRLLKYSSLLWMCIIIIFNSTMSVSNLCQ